MQRMSKGKDQGAEIEKKVEELRPEAMIERMREGADLEIEREISLLRVQRQAPHLPPSCLSDRCTT